MKNRNKIASLIAATVMVSATGCTPPQSINADAVAGPFRAVSARHDAYVSADANLSEVERRILLRDTEILNQIIDTATDTEE